MNKSHWWGTVWPIFQFSDWKSTKGVLNIPLLQNLQRNSLKDHPHCIHSVILSAAESYDSIFPSSPPPADHHRPPRLNTRTSPSRERLPQVSAFSETPPDRRFPALHKHAGKRHSRSTVRDLLFWSTDRKVPSQRHPDGRANHCSYRLFQLVGQPQAIPIPQQKNTLRAASLNLYHWKGNDLRILLAASCTPYLPVYTGNYTIISSHSRTHIIMGVYYFSPTTSASNSRKLHLAKPAQHGNSQLCQNIKEVGHASSSCILKQDTHTLQHLWLSLLSRKNTHFAQIYTEEFCDFHFRIKNGESQNQTPASCTA